MLYISTTKRQGLGRSKSKKGPFLSFVDGRDKAPEYALYMLNRQAVKNVTMPLIPGEMKASIVDPTTLQVARRGESMCSEAEPS